MSRRIKVPVLLLLLCLIIAAFAACKTETAAVKITLDRTTAEIEIQEKLTLTATVENASESDIVWSVQGDAATVENGVVLGVKEGSAAVSASIGDVSAECTVTVTDPGIVPVLNVDRSEIQFAKGAKLVVNASVTYNGKPVETEISFESENAEVVSVAEVSDEQAELTAVNYGQTVVVVSGNYNGVPLKETIAVNVISDVVMELDDRMPSDEGKYAVSLIMSDSVEGMEETELKTSFEALVSVYENGAEIEGAEFVWSADNQEVVNIENGVITAKSQGTAVVTVSYTAGDGREYSLEIYVDVSRAVVNIGESVDVETSGDSAGKLKLPFSPESGDTVESVTIGGTEVLLSNDGEIVLDVNKLDEIGHGKQQLLVLTKNAECKVPAEIITKVISTKAELDEVFHPATGGVDLDGYFVLGADIEYNDTWTAVGGTWDAANGGGGWSEKFSGTLDGRGWSINGLKIDGWDAGFILETTADAVIRNIGFKNSEMLGENANTFLVGMNYGTISNVYVSVSVVKVIVFRWRGVLTQTNYGTVENCFVETNKQWEAGDEGQFNGISGDNQGTLRNTYEVGNADWVRDSANKVVHYPDWEKFISANVEFPAADGWSEYWGKDADGKVTFGRKTAE